jgi:hypothetical protein
MSVWMVRVLGLRLLAFLPTLSPTCGASSTRLPYAESLGGPLWSRRDFARKINVISTNVRFKVGFAFPPGERVFAALSEQ